MSVGGAGINVQTQPMIFGTWKEEPEVWSQLEPIARDKVPSCKLSRGLCG
jgi:hypothetical protein